MPSVVNCRSALAKKKTEKRKMHDSRHTVFFVTSCISKQANKLMQLKTWNIFPENSCPSWPSFAKLIYFSQRKKIVTALDPLNKTKIYFNWSLFFAFMKIPPVWLLAADHEASVWSFTSYISSLPGRILPSILLILTIYCVNSNTCQTIIFLYKISCPQKQIPLFVLCSGDLVLGFLDRLSALESSVGPYLNTF